MYVCMYVYYIYIHMYVLYLYIHIYIYIICNVSSYVNPLPPLGSGATGGPWRGDL